MARNTKDQTNQSKGERLQETPRENNEPGEALSVLRTPASFPIIGMGASAGGLEALEEFFSVMPANPGAAFVIVVHLDPTHTSLLPELLQKKTKMPVLQIVSTMAAEPDHVYIIPPNKELVIVNSVFQLLPRRKPRGASLPIDVFLHSLALDQGSNAACIILSGTGTDGTLGLRSIKGEGGLVVVQTAESAKYSGMPLSAMATGLVDFTLAAEKIPEQLLKYVNHTGQVSVPLTEAEEKKQISTLHTIFALLKASTGHDFTPYKTKTISRRIERRMHVHQITHVEQYLDFLQENEQERKILFKEMLIGVTRFFRDTKAFDLLRDEYLPAVLAHKAEDEAVRIWVPGCSTGEEVYSIAIVLQEYMESVGHFRTVQIFGTDIDKDAISSARAGVYPAAIAADISPERLKRFFIQQDSQFQIQKSIRKMAVFAEQNVIKDPPFTRLDMLSCRNLFIYLSQELQRSLLHIFQNSLRPGGLLFLGAAESIGQAADLFTPVNNLWKLYAPVAPIKPFAARPSPQSVLNFSPLVETMPSMKKSKQTVGPQGQTVDNSALLKAILTASPLPACVVIDTLNNIVYVHGRTGQFFEPAEGSMSANIIDMARPGLKSALSSALPTLAQNRQEMRRENVQIKSNGSFGEFNLVIKPLPEFQTGSPGMSLVIFEPTIGKKQALVTIENKVIKNNDDEYRGLEEELKYTKINLQNTIEELQGANEELTSTNEELQSNNEELQSTNEELRTSREEMQFLNEESTTVKAELQSRKDEAIKANDDIKNLLDTTEMATLFLDMNLGVRRFNRSATRIFPLAQTDLGRPIQHFASKLVSLDLYTSCREVLRDLHTQEAEVDGTDGVCYRMRIRPYRTINNVIDGLVITFEDITRIVKMRNQLQRVFSSVEEQMLIMSKVFMDSADPIIIQNLEGTLVEVNDEAVQVYGWTRDELVGRNSLSLVAQDSLDQAKKTLAQCRSGKAMRNITEEWLHKSGSRIPVLATYSLLSGKDDQPVAIAVISKQYPPTSQWAPQDEK